MNESFQKAVDNHQVISFDIFDTLILRPYVKPADVFYHIERITGLKKFARNRIMAERKARRLVNAGEISYKDIYKQIGSKYKEVYDIELSFEKRICQRNEEIYTLYKYALEQGKTIIIVSDMYLDKEVIEEILEKTGYHSYKQLFLSSQYQQTKSSGKLFDIVLQTLKIEPKSILHVGDNPGSDIEMANSRGIQTLYYPKVIDQFLEEHSNLYALIRKNTDDRFKRDDLTISLVLGINAILWSENKTTNYWTRLGKLYAAPLLYFFTKWIYDNARENAIKNIAIVARDGYNVIRIFKLFDHKKEFNPQYVYLPRYVSETSNIHTVEDLHNFFEELGETSYSLKTFIDHFSEENQQIDHLWQEYLQKKGETNYQDLKDFILKHQHLFIQTSRYKRNLVFNYLSHKNLLDDNIMFVDSSTTQARAQKLIRSILSENNINVQLNGYYYKINQYHKILNQKDIRPYRDKKFRTDKWDIMEYFMSAPENPIISIQKLDDDYLPVYLNIDGNDFEKKRIETCKHMSDGAILFAERAYSIFDDIPIIKDLDTVVLIINNLINNPSTIDIAKTKKLQHTINNDSKYNPIITKYRKVKSSIPKIFGQQVHVERVSPELEHFFSGSPDALVMNTYGDEYLALNVPFMDREPHVNDKARVYVFNKSGCRTFVNNTAAWNFRNGASLQYRPGHKDEIFYNTYHNKQSGAIIINLNTKLETMLPMPATRLSDDGEKALGLVFPHKPLFDSYFTYSILPKKSDLAHCLEESGVCIMDLNSAKVKLVFSCAKILNYLNEKPSPDKKLFVEELAFTDKQDWYYLRLSLRKKGKTTITHKLFISFKGEIVPATLANEGEFFHNHYSTKKIIDSHTAKQNDEGKETIKENTAVLIQAEDHSQPFQSAKNNYSYSPDRSYYLSETSSNRDFPYIKLFLHDVHSRNSICLGYFYSNPDYYKNNKACIPLLNPRWSPNGKHIFIDSIHEGYRGIYRISSPEAIELLNITNKEIINEEELRSIIQSELPRIHVSEFDVIKKRSKATIVKILRYLSKNRLFESN